MSIKMFDFSELWTGATQLIDESTRSIFEYDAYAGKTKFPAVVLSPPVPYNSDQAGALIGVPKPEQESSDNQFLGDTVNRPGVFGFRARIIGPNSPHGFLPDPCATSISKKLPPDSKFKLVSMHTLFLSPQDYTIPSGEVLPSVGEVVLVELDNAQFGYNLEVGRFVSTITKPSMYFNEQTLTEQSCIDDKSGLDFTSTVATARIDLSNVGTGTAAPTPLKLSQEGKAFLGGDEGKRYSVYDDKGGIEVSSYSDVKGQPTIGVGHLITPNEESKFSKYLVGATPGKMTDAEITALWDQDIEDHSKFRKHIKKPVTQEMFDSLVSLAFNCGNNARSVLEACKAINREDYAAAAMAIVNGPTKSKGKDGVLRTFPGLVRRRSREANHFIAGGFPATTTPTA